MFVVVEEIMMVPMTMADGTYGSVGLLLGQGAGAVLSPGIFGLPPLSAEQLIVK